MRSSFSTVETKRHICDIQEHKCPLKFHLSTGMSLSSAGTFNKSLGNGSTFSNWSLLFGMNLTKHIDQSRHTLLLFFQTGLATLTEIFRITYWDQCVLKTCLPTKGCSKIMFRKLVYCFFIHASLVIRAKYKLGWHVQQVTQVWNVTQVLKHWHWAWSRSVWNHGKLKRLVINNLRYKQLIAFVYSIWPAVFSLS